MVRVLRTYLHDPERFRPFFPRQIETTGVGKNQTLGPRLFLQAPTLPWLSSFASGSAGRCCRYVGSLKVLQFDGFVEGRIGGAFAGGWGCPSRCHKLLLRLAKARPKPPLLVSEAQLLARGLSSKS